MSTSESGIKVIRSFPFDSRVSSGAGNAEARSACPLLHEMSQKSNESATSLAAGRVVLSLSGSSGYQGGPNSIDRKKRRIALAALQCDEPLPCRVDNQRSSIGNV